MIQLEFWIQKNKERREKIYNKEHFFKRVYGMAFCDRIEYGIPGETHPELEKRIGIQDAIVSNTAIEQGWVRFSNRHGELEIQCLPSNKSRTSIHNLLKEVTSGHYYMEINGDYKEFDTTNQLLDWIDSHF